MIEIGTLAIKTCGRDGNNYCIVVDKIDDNFVLIDGNTRRKKCNIKHLEPIKKLDVKKGASSEAISKVLEAEGITIKQKGRPRQPGERPKKIRKKKEKPKQKKPKEKKQEKPKEEKREKPKKEEKKEEPKIIPEKKEIKKEEPKEVKKKSKLQE